MQPREISTPWRRAIKLKHQRQEERFAKKEGGTPQLNSGRTWSGLRDVTLKSFLGKLLFDNKTTEAHSYSVTENDWAALKRDANRTPPGCLPALNLEIRDLSLIVFEEGTWDELVKYVMRIETLNDDAINLLNRYRDEYGEFED